MVRGHGLNYSVNFNTYCSASAFMIWAKNDLNLQCNFLAGKVKTELAVDQVRTNAFCIFNKKKGKVEKSFTQYGKKFSTS